MENLEWILDGIGTEFMGLAISAIVGGFVGYKIGVHKSGKQIQKAKEGSKQRQEMIVEGDELDDKKENVNNKICQTQKAGKNSEQVQVGRIKNGKQ